MKLNQQYLSTLPPVSSRLQTEFLEDETCIFEMSPDLVGDEKGQQIGGADERLPLIFTLTNKRILIYNGAGLWAASIDEIEDFTFVETKWAIFFKTEYFLITLKDYIHYGEKRENKLHGFQLYLRKNDTENKDALNNLLENIKLS